MPKDGLGAPDVDGRPRAPPAPACCICPRTVPPPAATGKLAAAKRLTKESESEQAGAGLDALTDDERSEFTKLNEDYKEKFGFPFIIAVKGLTKKKILNAFHQRVGNDRDTEFDTACQQVERIARLRLNDMFNEQD